MTTAAKALMWFRDDLRLRDNAALEWLAGKGPVEALYVLDTSRATRPLGRASLWWLHHSLTSLAKDLAAADVRLRVITGDPAQVVPTVVQELGAEHVAWSRRYYQPWCEMDAGIKKALKDRGVHAQSFPGHLLLEPWDVTTQTGGGYKVYTPFSRRALELLDSDSLEHEVIEHEHLIGSDYLDTLHGTGADLSATAREITAARLLPSHRGEPDWDKDFSFSPGEAGAQQLLADFLPVGDYQKQRDFPSVAATSTLSPHLRFGEISVARVFASAGDSPDALVFRKELLWRDFAWHRLYAHPEMVTHSLREKFTDFPWWHEDYEPDAIYRKEIDPTSQLSEFAAWARGETGIGLVDAGMRELRATGTMHNRVRMVVGSLLTKNLGIHWRMGERWFWDALLDADMASNTFNWQWVAGCGDDAAPYFRIFNPETQRERFDPKGTYCTQWVEELNTPFYPEPIVDLKLSRKIALEAYQSLAE